ncbi:hypothetical protein JCM8097_004439 [Rhodosporidiobolus ruineniae]
MDEAGLIDSALLFFPSTADAARVLARFHAAAPVPLPRSGRTCQLGWANLMPGLQVRLANEYKLCVANLGLETTETELLCLFRSLFPSTSSASIVYDYTTGLSCQYGYIYFTTAGDLDRALGLAKSKSDMGLALRGRVLFLSEPLELAKPREGKSAAAAAAAADLGLPDLFRDGLGTMPSLTLPSPGAAPPPVPPRPGRRRPDATGGISSQAEEETEDEGSDRLRGEHRALLGGGTGARRGRTALIFLYMRRRRFWIFLPLLLLMWLVVAAGETTVFIGAVWNAADKHAGRAPLIIIGVGVSLTLLSIPVNMRLKLVDKVVARFSHNHRLIKRSMRLTADPSPTPSSARTSSLATPRALKKDTDLEVSFKEICYRNLYANVEEFKKETEKEVLIKDNKGKDNDVEFYFREFCYKDFNFKKHDEKDLGFDDGVDTDLASGIDPANFIDFDGTSPRFPLRLPSSLTILPLPVGFDIFDGLDSGADVDVENRSVFDNGAGTARFLDCRHVAGAIGRASFLFEM